MALGLRNGMRGGAQAAWWTGLGCCTGICVWAVAAVVGLSAALAASATAFIVVKLGGATYLVYLGAASLWHSRPSAGATTAPDAVEMQDSGQSRVAFRQELMSNLLNPKIGGPGCAVCSSVAPAPC